MSGREKEGAESIVVGSEEERSCLELKTDICHGQAVTLTDAEEKKKMFLNGTSSASTVFQHLNILRVYCVEELLGGEDFCHCWGRYVREMCFASARADSTFVRDHG